MPQRHEVAQPFLAQIQSSPEQKGHVDREERVGQQRAGNADVGSNRAAEVPGQQQPAQYRRARHQIQNEAYEFDDTDPLDAIGRIAQCNRSLDGRPEPEDLEDGVEGEKERGQSRADMADIYRSSRTPKMPSTGTVIRSDAIARKLPCAS